MRATLRALHFLTFNFIPQMRVHLNSLFESFCSLSPSSWPRTRRKHLESLAKTGNDAAPKITPSILK